MGSTLKETYKLETLGRDELIAEVYNRYGKKLYAYALRSWNMNDDAAWELIYKTIYKVIDSYRSYTFENEEKFASFVFRIFINYLRNYYRDNRQERMMAFTPIEENDIEDKAPHANTEALNPKLAALNEELEKMEDWQRMLLLMRSQGMTYAEIAKYVDKPENQLKVYYQRLKEQVTKKLNERSK